MRHILLLPALLVFGMTASPVRAADIAVILSAEVDAYEKTLRGFAETVDHRIVAEYDMAGDFDRGQRILAEIRSEVKPDLILAVGIWALQVIVREPLDVPVVFAMVLNPPTIIGSEPRNITGASMNVPVDKSIQILEELGPEVRRIGVIYNPTTTGYLVKTAGEAAQERGLELVAREAASPKQAVQAVNALQTEGIDALWILPDETVLDPTVLEYALLSSYRYKVPLLGLSERQAEMGALLSVSFGSSQDIGRQAGELANAILEGGVTGPIPYTTARTLRVVVNLKAAEKLGVEIPESILAMADTVIR
ncbi:ABC transporter substrate-binding protein [Rhodospirillaceae bacterium SYSU D60014]|uniref:ABC transporter substrate-binding protein n=1 Tax=Virgifigura deserti TaxID=2268457 RepID=UPI000E674915